MGLAKSAGQILSKYPLLQKGHFLNLMNFSLFDSEQQSNKWSLIEVNS
jgi:hypothetical protein